MEDAFVTPTIVVQLASDIFSVPTAEVEQVTVYMDKSALRLILTLRRTLLLIGLSPSRRSFSSWSIGFVFKLQ